MNKIYKHCLIYVVLLLSTSQAFASHIMGMDLSFTCKGNDTITFTLNFYRDCAGIAPIIKPLYIQSVSNNYYSSITLTEVGSPEDISPLCPKDLDSSTCYNPNSTLPGAQDWIYTGTFVLPYYAKDWLFYYDDEARNPAITNIINPGNTGIRIQDSLDNSSEACVNSPIFSTPPVPYVCNGDPYSYNNGGYDPDGDSLSYELVAPIDGNTDAGVIYIPGLSYDSVLIEEPGVPYSLNPVTGEISFTAAQGVQQITVTALRIYIHRAGKVIGYVTRDIEIIVRNCTNTAPYASGIQNLVGGGLTGANSLTLCANTNTSFQITAKDSDLPKQAITAATNAALVLPGSTVTVTDTNPAYINISWLPTDADTGYHNFTLSIKDDYCPIYAISVYSYQIYVSPSTIAGPKATTLCQGQSVQLNAGGGSRFVWTPSAGLNNADTSAPLATPTITTSYIVTSNLSNICKNKDTVQVVVQDPFTVSIDADTGQICPGTATPLKTVIKGGSGTYTYSWRSVPVGFTSTSASVSDTPLVPTTYYVVATNGPCSDSISFRLNIDTTANAAFAVKDTVCASQQYVVTYAGHSPVNATYDWTFNGGTVLSGSGRGPYLVDYIDPGGPYVMSLKVTNPDGCTAFQTKNIYVGTPFSVKIDGDPTICRTSSTTLETSIGGGGNNGAYNFTWTSTPTGYSSDSASPVVSPVYTTTYHVLSQSDGCSDTTSFAVTVDSNALATFMAIDTICQLEPFNVTFQGYSQVAAQYAWGFGGGTVLSGTGRGPYSILYSTPGLHKVSLLITNPDGCTDSSSQNVYAAPPFNIKISGDTIVCPTYSVTLNATGGGIDSPYTYSWKSNPLGFSSASSNPLVTPVGTTTYYVLAQSKTGCIDSAAFVVRVDSLANSKFSIPDTVCVGEQLTASYTGVSPQNSQYKWTFNGANAVQGSGKGPYTIQYSKAGTYRITLNVIDSFGCSDTSSKTLFIEPLPQDTFSASPLLGCEPQAVSFNINAPSGSTFLWSFGDGSGSTQQDPTHIYKHGIYTVTLTVTDKFGCAQTYIHENYIAIDTSVVAAFTVDADTSSLYDFTTDNFQFTNQSKYADSYTWYFGDGTSSTEVNPKHSYKNIGVYYITLIACDTLGCCDTTEFGPLHVLNLNDFYLPDAFTPQAGKNNHFHILGYGLTDAVLRVYNRWGGLIWEGSGATATDASMGWDGTYNGKLQPMDTYVWLATAKLASGKAVIKKGDVTLIR